MNPSPPQLLLLPRLLAITGSLFLSGFAFSASYYSIPALALAPTPLRLRQWLVIYDLGKLVSPPVATATAVAWAWAAWEAARGSGNGSEEWKFYAVAALATFGVPAWTVGVMMTTNLKLVRMAKVAKEESGSGSGNEKDFVEAEKLVATWKWMNYVRAVIPMVGAWVGIYAALKSNGTDRFQKF